MWGDIEDSDSQFRAAWKHFADRLPGGREAQLEGIQAVFSGVAIPFFNVLFFESGIETSNTFTQCLEGGIRWANEQGVPWLLCVRDDDLARIAGAQEVVASAGFQPVMPFTGMIADELNLSNRSIPELELRLVQDPESRGAIVDVNSLAYGMPTGDRSELDSERLWDASAFGVVGYLNGEPVSSSATFLVDGRLYVGWVATVPEHRRKGYADACMRRSLEEAAKVHGWRKSVLHATPFGRPVYERMGYRCAVTYTLYGIGH